MTPVGGRRGSGSRNGPDTSATRTATRAAEMPSERMGSHGRPTPLVHARAFVRQSGSIPGLRWSRAILSPPGPHPSLRCPTGDASRCLTRTPSEGTRGGGQLHEGKRGREGGGGKGGEGTAEKVPAVAGNKPHGTMASHDFPGNDENFNLQRRRHRLPSRRGMSTSLIPLGMPHALLPRPEPPASRAK